MLKMWPHGGAVVAPGLAARQQRGGGAMQHSGYGAYRKIQAETSSSGELVWLLYEALQTNLARAEAALGEGNLELANAPLVRAQEIVLELAVSLDMDQGQLPEQLAALYEYAYRRLVDANLRKEVAIVHEVRRVIAPLREAWGRAVHPGSAALALAAEGTPRE